MGNKKFILSLKSTDEKNDFCNRYGYSKRDVYVFNNAENNLVFYKKSNIIFIHPGDKNDISHDDIYKKVTNKIKGGIDKCIFISQACNSTNIGCTLAKNTYHLLLKGPDKLEQVLINKKVKDVKIGEEILNKVKEEYKNIEEKFIYEVLQLMWKEGEIWQTDENRRKFAEKIADFLLTDEYENLVYFIKFLIDKEKDKKEYIEKMIYPCLKKSGVWNDSLKETIKKINTKIANNAGKA